ncbi:MAG: MerR family transcriptional regulator [Alphaproteobacteria bacterium]|nr:MerR family transcriptional regulator [Alphaproteobacteria bacterium]
MADASVIRAFDGEQVVRLTGLSQSQLRYWDDTGFFRPEYGTAHRTPIGRIYSFQNVLGLRTLSVLRKEYQVPLQQLRKVAVELYKHRNEPWSQLTLYVLGKSVYFKEPETGKVREALSGQYTALALKTIAEDLATAANNLRNRTESQIGRIERHRYIVHNAWAMAGSRVPVATIKRFHEAGYSSAAIVREFPVLTKQDVEAAIQYEVKRVKRA